MLIEIYSEINPLKSVILHQPGEEHFFINPKNLNEWLPGKNKLVDNPNYLLFDDLINPQKAKKEHNVLSQIIKKFTGEKKCIEFTDLLLDILNDMGIQLPSVVFNETASLENMQLQNKELDLFYFQYNPNVFSVHFRSLFIIFQYRSVFFITI